MAYEGGHIVAAHIGTASLLMYLPMYGLSPLSETTSTISSNMHMLGQSISISSLNYGFAPLAENAISLPHPAFMAQAGFLAKRFSPLPLRP